MYQDIYQQNATCAHTDTCSTARYYQQKTTCVPQIQYVLTKCAGYSKLSNFMSLVLKHPQAIMSAPLYEDNISLVITFCVTVIKSHHLPDEFCNVHCISHIYNCLFLKDSFL